MPLCYFVAETCGTSSRGVLRCCLRLAVRSRLGFGGVIPRVLMVLFHAPLNLSFLWSSGLLLFSSSMWFLVEMHTHTHTQSSCLLCLTLVCLPPNSKAVCSSTVLPGSDCCFTESLCASLSFPTSFGETAPFSFHGCVETAFPFPARLLVCC